jgi:hypothetical protein
MTVRALADRDRRFKTNLMHAQDARFVFVRILRNTWVRLDACVAVADCPQCKAPIGQPCRGSDGLPRTPTHWMRRRKASGKWPRP